jgi:hypothetical protein
MKHYSELMKIETDIIDFEVLTSLCNVLSNGMGSSTSAENQNAMFHLSAQMMLLQSRMYANFNELFSKIRDEENDREAKKRKPKSKRNNA